MLKGRLGLESARIPQTDRHGLLWLGRGNLVVQDGCLHFLTAGWEDLPAGDYSIPIRRSRQAPQKMPGMVDPPRQGD